MTKSCRACGYENQDIKSHICPKCERYYTKTEDIQRKSENDIKSRGKNSKNKEGSGVFLLIFVSIISLSIGYFSGREHVKYGLEKSVSSREENTAGEQDAPANEVINKKTAKSLENSTSSESSSWRGACSAISNMAEEIMKARQNGAAMSSLIESVQGVEENHVAERFIMLAYDKSRYHTDRNILRSIEDFKNEAYLECAKSIR